MVLVLVGLWPNFLDLDFQRWELDIAGTYRDSQLCPAVRYLLQLLLSLRTQMPLCTWPVFVVPWRPGSDFDEQDSKQCAYPGEQLSLGEQGTPWPWEAGRPLRISHQLPAKSGLFPAVLTLCSTPQNPAKQVDSRCLLDSVSRSSPWYTSHIFFLSSFAPNRTSLFTARNSFLSLVFMLCEYL